MGWPSGGRGHVEDGVKSGVGLEVGWGGEIQKIMGFSG